MFSAHKKFPAFQSYVCSDSYTSLQVAITENAVFFPCQTLSFQYLSLSVHRCSCHVSLDGQIRSLNFSG
jgi:hypothetical protein